MDRKPRAGRLLAVLGSATLMAMAFPAGAGGLPLERIFAAPDINGPVARGTELSPDGKLVTWLKPKAANPQVLDLWAAPANGDGPERLLVDSATLSDGAALDEAEVARRERQRVFDAGIVEYRWDSQGKHILVPVSGELFVADVATGAVRKRIPRAGPGGDATDARFSPLGTHVSFIRRGTLVVAATDGGAERALSPPGEGVISYGVAEFVAQEEMARDTGYWWRPDDGAIAYTRVDEGPVAIAQRAEFAAGATSLVSQRYPFAGTANAGVSLFVQQLAGGAPVQVDLGVGLPASVRTAAGHLDIYLARVNWSVDGGTLYVQRQSRDQKTLDLLAVDPASGRARVVLTERQSPWVDLNLDFRPLRDGGFLWTSTRSGFRHLYLYDRNAQLVRQVTSGAFPLAGIDRQASLLGVDEGRGIAYVLAAPDTPIERDLYAVDYRRGGPMRRVTAGGGWWTPRMNADATAFVATFANPETPPQTALYGVDGQRRRWIVENRLDATHPYFPYLAGLPKPDFGTLAAEDGQALHYVLLKPAGFDPAKRYPAIVQVYGGPGRQHVYRGWRNPTERVWLDNGFVVFQLDNRGTSGRGLKFEGVIADRLGGPEVADQIRGLRFVQGLPYVDPARVGVTGWSYGGFMTLRLMTEPGAGFAAGAAGAAPGLWKAYDTHYTERFLGMPDSNAAAYDAASVVPRLGRLAGELHLMHGMSDDNVLFDNATAIMARLQADARPFELMLYPGQRHSIQTAPLKTQQWRTWLAFFQRTLGGPQARK